MKIVKKINYFMTSIFLRRMGTNETDKTPYFIYFSILILIFENICFMWEIKFIYPFYPSHLLLSVSLLFPYLIRL